ncbi:MAG: FtsX-like permease family protein, partial [Cytophagales bacterium]|nr:FtsX-like permease family protein [Cytophagales bacterium]
SRRQLAVQLYAEAQLLVLVALGFAVLLAVVFLPVFNEFTEKTLVFNWTQQPGLVVCALGLALLVGLVAGGYPALVLSGFQVTSMLKGSRTYRFSPTFSNALVFVQYSLCLFLLTCAVVMQQQMKYIASKDLGYDKEQVLVLNNYTTNSEKTVTLLQRFKDIAARNPAIAGVSGTSFSFGQGEGFYEFYFKINKELTAVYVYNTDVAYLKMMDIKLLAGRNFLESWRSDSTGVIVNETLANMLGGADKILGQKPKELNRFNEIKIIGVVKDFHFGTLQDKMLPVMFSADLRQLGKFLVKVKPGRIPETLDFVQNTWKQLAPDQPFDYSFVDQDVAAQYRTYRQWTNIIATATVFAVFMACLGLFGLSGLNAANRTKEIGIRKVLGASVTQVFVLLNRKTVVLAVLSFVVAFPAAHYLMSRWLEDFAYRIDISWEVFAITGLVGVAAALLAVSFYSLRAATENPVKALRSE